MKPKVFVTRQIPEAGLAILRDRTDLEVWPHGDIPVPREVLADRMPHLHGVLTLLSDPIDRGIIDRGPHLKVISNYAVGTDNIDVAFAQARGITVTNTPDVLTDATADLAFALILGTARKVLEGNQVARSGRWAWAPDLLGGYERDRDSGERRWMVHCSEKCAASRIASLIHSAEFPKEKHRTFKGTLQDVAAGFLHGTTDIFMPRTWSRVDPERLAGSALQPIPDEDCPDDFPDDTPDEDDHFDECGEVPSGSAAARSSGKG